VIEMLHFRLVLSFNADKTIVAASAKSSSPSSTMFVVLETWMVQSLSTQRPATNGDYIVPRTHRKLGERAISVTAPKAWNQLPTNLKRQPVPLAVPNALKTFLF